MIELLPWDGKFGRHVNHDPRSRAFPVELPTVPVRNRLHRRYGAVLDQGNLGSCTGNAAVQTLNHKPFYHGKHQTEEDAVSVYSRATEIDPFDGQYPPEDTGSDGTSVAKVLKERGIISGYTHIFGYAAEAIQVIQHKPFIIGVSFYEGMYNYGNMTPSGNLLGGHEMVVTGWYKNIGFRILNSWGQWGFGGYGWMTESSFDWLMHDSGDATVFVE
jgi:C1A family cysteine protease